MFTRPARVEMIAPSATIRRGAASVSVLPHRPGLRMLPSSSALRTDRQGPPVIAIRNADIARASRMKPTYSATVPRRRRRCRSCIGHASEQQAEPFGRRLAPWQLADDSAAGHHDDPVGEIEDLLELG